MDNIKTPDQIPLTREDLEQIEKRLDNITSWMIGLDHTLKVILCCSLLPKDGPNWAYYESLFSSAEKMMFRPHSKHGRDLTTMVREILNGDHYDDHDSD